MVSVRFLENSDRKYSFIVDNTDFVSLNTLRRIIGYQLPIYAIEELEITENDSVVVDEMLANRIGLCPVSTPLDNTGKKVTFNLEVEGEKTVYTKDFRSNDQNIQMVYDNIPLTKINEGQRINLTGYAYLGIGKTHIKYSPAIISYSQIYELKRTTPCKKCSDFFDSIKDNAVEKQTDNRISIHPKNYDLTVSYIEKCDKNCLKLNTTNSYILDIELIGQMPIKELLTYTKRHVKEYVNVLKKKLK